MERPVSATLHSNDRQLGSWMALNNMAPSCTQTTDEEHVDGIERPVSASLHSNDRQLGS